MYKLCKTDDSTNRQREVEQILLSLMREKKYEEISVTEICERAKMPRKSFYRYFDGKDGAMQSLLHHTMAEYDMFRINDAAGKISTEFESLFNFWKGKRDFLEAFDKSNLIGLVVESANNYAMKEYSDVKKYLSENDSNEKIIAYQFVIYGLMTMTINWYRGGFVESVPNMARMATKIITKPLFENLSRSE